MYASAFVLGFHGCDESVGEKILAGKEHLKTSVNEYDWLGEGIYLWENSPRRALDWAEFVHANPKFFKTKITKPFVLGAIVDLGLCLDLTEAGSLMVVREAHDALIDFLKALKYPIPKNQQSGSKDEDLVKRHLDCAVINYVHAINETAELPQYDTVRGMFSEGTPLYPNGRIMAKTHVQIAVRHSRLIRGYFRPILPIEK